MPQRPNTPQNQILSALPAEEYQRLLPHLEVVDLPIRKVLFGSGDRIEYVYFPHRSIISLVTILDDGATVEVGLVGNEGMAGVEVFLDDAIATNQAIVQVADSATRLPASVLKAEFNRCETLQKLLLHYMNALFFQVSQGAACYRRHPIEERLARWLLMVSDRVGSDEITLTHDFISQMLGTRRAGVTIAAGALKQAGLIRYHRGNIMILEHQQLEEVACECYQLTKSMFKSLSIAQLS
ncbi:Crp/Fnr family transcriptional regulator [Myxacorys almedinensis]|uniref:Helix-turn-helix domain-containing protein n=1 Tax=Myxacorys almedinensis A TaxID=2690445 RepID=A0A8J7Z472_9CYAN|nr:Crp/Fnr family transcriptional regulator [Myxacorys almedinensis]NDJ17866.1 helix-turn-helix domain-containing protein [Myxacorys almedinensis A]